MGKNGFGFAKNRQRTSDIDVPERYQGRRDFANAPALHGDGVVFPLIGDYTKGVEAKPLAGQQYPRQVVGLSDHECIGYTEDVQCTVTGIVGAPSGVIQNKILFWNAEFESEG